MFARGVALQDPPARSSSLSNPQFSCAPPTCILVAPHAVGSCFSSSLPPSLQHSTGPCDVYLPHSHKALQPHIAGGPQPLLHSSLIPGIESHQRLEVSTSAIFITFF